MAQISQLGVDLPEMKLLEAAVERLEGFQLRARGAAAGKPSRQHLTDLQQVTSPRQNCLSCQALLLIPDLVM